MNIFKKVFNKTRFAQLAAAGYFAIAGVGIGLLQGGDGGGPQDWVLAAGEKSDAPIREIVLGGDGTEPRGTPPPSNGGDGVGPRKS